MFELQHLRVVFLLVYLEFLVHFQDRFVAHVLVCERNFLAQNLLLGGSVLHEKAVEKYAA